MYPGGSPDVGLSFVGKARFRAFVGVSLQGVLSPEHIPQIPYISREIKDCPASASSSGPNYVFIISGGLPNRRQTSAGSLCIHDTKCVRFLLFSCSVLLEVANVVGGLH